MLIGLDEQLVHQVTATFAGVGGSDPQWNDGHYVCLCDSGGRVSLTTNVRFYQNNDVADGFVCLRHRGLQHNLRVSRRLRTDMDTLGIGPLRVEIVEPMQTLRLVLDPGDHGFALDVLCHSTGVPYEDPVDIVRVDGRLTSERLTYELAGWCEGWVQVGSERYELAQGGASFFRNHSWGYQGGRGGPRLYGAPGSGKKVRPEGVRQWVLFDCGDHAGYYHLFDAPGGKRSFGRGAILLPDRSITIVDVDSQLDYYDGGRRLRHASIDVLDAEGERWQYEADDLGWVYCQGGGYFGGFDDGLGQGVYRGDDYREGEVWDVSDPVDVVDADGRRFRHPNDWAENFMRLRRPDGREGLAHFECVVFP